jgi:hypothetical protein
MVTFTALCGLLIAQLTFNVFETPFFLMCPQILGLVPLLHIRNFLRCAISILANPQFFPTNPQIANPQLFMINPQIANPQIF